MNSLPSRAFLRNKIMDLRQALFFNDSYSVLKFPISIINVLQVDEVGQVWFMVARPTQHLNEFETEFRARLALYKKGKDFFLNVSGKACIVTDPEEITHVDGLDDASRKLALSSMVLIRMSISDVQYFPTGKPVSRIAPSLPKVNFHPSALVKSLQYVIKDIIPVFQSH